GKIYGSCPVVTKIDANGNIYYEVNALEFDRILSSLAETYAAKVQAEIDEAAKVEIPAGGGVTNIENVVLPPVEENNLNNAVDDMFNESFVDTVQKPAGAADIYDDMGLVDAPTMGGR
ncbi:MAG: hypothetical protein RSD96_01270, partial [Bacilli bacterium]